MPSYFAFSSQYLSSALALVKREANRIPTLNELGPIRIEYVLKSKLFGIKARIGVKVQEVGLIDKVTS